MRALLIAALLFGLVNCSSSSSVDDPAPTQSVSPAGSTVSTSTPSPAPEAWQYCDHASAVGHLVRQTRKGTQLPDELVTEAETLRNNILAYSRELLDGEPKDALRGLAAAVGKLQLAIAGAGASYPFNGIVRIRARTVSFAGFSAALRLDCAGLLD